MENKSKLNTVLLIIIIILLVIVSGYLFIKDSKWGKDNLLKNDFQENQIVGDLSTPKLDNQCPESIKNIRIFDLVINNNGLSEAQVYYKLLPTEYNNYSFDQTVKCNLPFSKMIVYGPYGDNGLEMYEYTEFSRLNTWDNYLSNRTKKDNYVTNVFSVTKTNSGIVLDELYQE